MKKIFWTTFFRLVVALGFLFYVKMYNIDIANDFSTWLGATAIVSQDALDEGGKTDLMTEIITIQDTLADIQATLAGETISGIGETIPEVVVEAVPEVEAE